MEALMSTPAEFRQPDAYARIRSLLTTLQLRIDLLAGAQGGHQTDSAFLEAIHQDIANLAEIVREKRQVLRVAQDRACLDPSNYLARSS